MQKSNGSLSTMHDCSSVVGQMYTNPEFQKIIQKIPENYRDDIKQEAALKLLEMPCPKVVELFSKNNLFSYVNGLCYHIAVDKRHPLSINFRSIQERKAEEYVSTKTDLPTLPDSYGDQAKKILSEKNKNEHEYLEQLVFLKYAELGSARKVAEHFKISRYYVDNIVKKVKAELKCTLLQ